MENKQFKYEVNEEITKKFDEIGIHYRVDNNTPLLEIVEAGFPIKCGPSAFMRFISHSDDNDIAVRVYGIMTIIPKEKHARIREVCNFLNRERRYMKYILDEHGSVNVEYDFHRDCPANFIAGICVKMFIGWAHNISSDYKLFIKAAYTDGHLSLNRRILSPEALLKIMRLKEKLGDIGDSSSIDDISDVLFDTDDLDFGEDDNYENDEEYTDRFSDNDNDESDDNITDDDADNIYDGDEEICESDDDTST